MSDAKDQTPSLPRNFGGYELIEEIGSGGMGVIYRARQPGLDRLCAVKMLKADSVDKGWSEEQLRAEAKAAASLDHPNIVGILEVGQAEGRLYFSMELVEGQDLTRLVRGRLLSSKVVAGYVRKIAEAVHYAHARGILHCDLKPANILIDQRDEPRITDFGLARRIGFDSAKSRSDYGAGSPNFMAPEQVSAKCGSIGVGTDIFGIGATLYYLLTDRPPFRGESLTSTLQAVVEDDPVPPRALRPGIPIDLETICLKCLEKRPVRRYHSVAEVVEELDRFLEDIPVKARHITEIERGWRMARRHPVLIGMALAIASLVATVAIVSSIATIHINRLLEITQQDNRRVRASELETRRNLYASGITLAFQALAEGNNERVRELLQSLRPTGDATNDLRGWEWRFLWGQSAPDELKIVADSGATVDSIHLLSEGREILTSDNSFHVKRWELATGRQLQSFQPHAASSVITLLDPKERWLAVTDREPQARENRVRLVDPRTGNKLIEFDGIGFSNPRAASADGNELWIVNDQEAIAYSTERGTLLRRIAFSGKNPQRMFTVSTDGRRAAWGLADGGVILGDARTGKLVQSFEGHSPNPPFPSEVDALEFSPDGNLLVSGASDGKIRIWDTEAHRARPPLTAHPDIVTTLAFSHNGHHLFSSGRDPFLRIWHLPDGRLESTLRHHSGIIHGALFLPDDHELLTASEDGKIRLWPVQAPVRAETFTQLPPGYGMADFTPDGLHFEWNESTASGGKGGIRPIFGTKSLIDFNLDTNVLARAVVLPKGEPGWVATYRFGGVVRVESVVGGTLLERPITNWITMPMGGSSSASFSADGRRLLIVDLYNGIQVFGIPEMTLIRQVKGPRFEAAALSPDGHWFAGVQLSGASMIGSVDQDLSHSVPAGAFQVQAIVFSPDGSEVAFESLAGEVRVYRVNSGGSIGTFHAPSSGIVSVAFSTDGKRLAVGSIEGTIYFWDLGNGRELGAFHPDCGMVGGIRFSDDGSLMVLGSKAHCRWKVPTLAEIDAQVTAASRKGG